jgi:hypothetical protein
MKRRTASLPTPPRYQGGITAWGHGEVGSPSPEYRCRRCWGDASDCSSNRAGILTPEEGLEPLGVSQVLAWNVPRAS